MIAWLGGVALVVGGWLGSADGPGAIPTGVTRVEEDWELVVGVPDPTNSGPQITTVMSPMIQAPWIQMTFNLNYRDDPFAGGGMQIRLWSDKQVIAQKSVSAQQIATANETIGWTQAISLNSGILTLEVKNGNSTTWGTFGGSALRLQVATSLPNLDGYQVSESVANSGCGYQSNRVRLMRLKEVRYYVGNELVVRDDQPKVLLANAE
ncbi:MAG: hypothetical protein KatS3mg108_2820 [Isosphaeraceae bacterium]|jgi:hypothetical protein|nr:MAG: hypothetical protein KatS3mg108_2820 [Isosphaeraceae bacterium]